MNLEKEKKGEKARLLQPDLHDPAVHDSLDRYWKATVRLTVVLLLIWAAAGLGAGIIVADLLNQYQLPGTGYPLGFWFAQQGSIVIFIILILIYCLTMNRLDRRHHQELQRLEAEKEVQE